tara:strand:- start:3740 stop:4150 length:411 start_codon:yes stop_codon:yes gene_type:complete
MISFTITGQPIALKRHRVARNGRMYDPSYKDKKQIWLQIAKYKPKKPLKGDIYMKAIFYFQRPKNHFRSGKYSHLLKDAYKDVIYKGSIPDLDNCVKLIADIIQPQMICDDSQICMLQAEKMYSTDPRTEVVIQEI